MNAGEKSLLKALDQGGIVALVDQYGNYICKQTMGRGYRHDLGSGVLWQKLKTSFPVQPRCCLCGRAE